VTAVSSLSKFDRSQRNGIPLFDNGNLEQAATKSLINGKNSGY
jgi:hypothetical protein